MYIYVCNGCNNVVVQSYHYDRNVNKTLENPRKSTNIDSLSPNYSAAADAEYIATKKYSSIIFNSPRCSFSLYKSPNDTKPKSPPFPLFSNKNKKDQPLRQEAVQS